jgi:hypothetical protein
MGESVKIIDEPLLHEFRYKPWCEHCRAPVFYPLEPHHLRGKGLGGWRRFDVKYNLISLCRDCHRAYHEGRIDKVKLLAIVARRERVTVEELEEMLRRLTDGGN